MWCVTTLSAPNWLAFLVWIKDDVRKLTSRMAAVGLRAAVVVECEEDNAIVSAALQSHIFVDVYCTNAGRGQTLISKLQESWNLTSHETVVVIVGPRVVPDEWRSCIEEGCLTVWRVGQPVPKDGPHLQSLAQVLPLVVQKNCNQVHPAPLIAGVLMKSSTYSEFVRRGILQVLPTDGLCLFPLDLDIALEKQGPIDGVLLRRTDSLVRVQDENGKKMAVLPEEITKLEAYLAANPQVCVVDPLEYWQMLLDRIEIDKLLERMSLWQQDHLPVCRPPRYVTVDDFSDPQQLFREMSAAGIVLPVIVKPAAACAIPGLDRLALVSSIEGFQGLQLGRPACIQEYVNHGGIQYTIYVAGDEVFVQKKRSTPDILASTLGETLPGESAGVVYFDSLKELPKVHPGSPVNHPISHLEEQVPSSSFTYQEDDSFWQYQETYEPGYEVSSKMESAGASNRVGFEIERMSPRDSLQPGTELSPHHPSTLDWEAANLIAAFLKTELKLSLFGFDVLVDTKTGDHVVVDVNYFPCFEGMDGAAEEIRAAIKCQILAHKESRLQVVM